jgi:Signal peptidase, peptidase S26
VTERRSGSREPAGGLAVAEPGPAEPETALARAVRSGLDAEGGVRSGPGRRHRVLRCQGPSGPDHGIVGGSFHWLSGALGIERAELEDSIKRVIRLPGETVELRGSTRFVLGDRTNSNDSRFGLGCIPQDKVIGRALWPPSRVGWISW